MSPTERQCAVAVALVIIGIGGAGIAAAAKPGPPPSQPDATSFEMSGTVDRLVPAVASTLQLKVENRHSFTIEVVDARVTVGDPDGACLPSDLAIDPVPVPFEVPAAGERTVAVAVSLAADVQNACQGATWPLQYHGTAERVRREPTTAVRR